MNKHREFCRRAAADGMVLLRNENNLLPFSGNQKVALFGRGQYMTMKSGGGSGDVCGVEVVHLIEGFKNASVDFCSELSEFGLEWHKANGGTVQYSHELYKENNSIDEIEYTDEILNSAASFTDTAVVIISRTAGECFDIKYEKGDFFLSATEITLLQRVRSAFPKMAILLNLGGCYDLLEIEQIAPDALLYVQQGGQEIGNAITDVLFGKVTPSGKLSDTWVRNYDDLVVKENFGEMEIPYIEGVFVGYRYYDTFNIKPMYPFGFGLSYTNFNIDVTNVNVSGTLCKVEVCVKNIGVYSGKEVIQLYVSKPDGQLEKPYQDLVAFKKTKLLAPNETQTVFISFDLKEIASYSETDEAFILENGNYYLRVGNCSRDTHVAACLAFSQTIRVFKTKNLFSLSKKFETISKSGIKPYSYEQELGEMNNCNQIAVDITDFVENEAHYSGNNPLITLSEQKIHTLDDVADGKITAEQLVSEMTPFQLLCLLNGSCNQNLEFTNGIIGNMAISVEGAAAETYAFPELKIPTNICADGPAGIRLMSTSYDFSKISLEDKRRTLTAYPSGTCFANSWDFDLCVEYGRNICEEMDNFGIDGWLAPGMNIHRNPLCGRNFEYLSEDPFLSGMLAAAETIGVQYDENGKITGKYATIKHFAANNQEMLRCESTSEITERAFREIYLKGFEIAVKLAKPHALMTSYNRINGIFATIHKSMLQGVLRDEWGFGGIVMSDWGANGDAKLRPNAGNDLNMPGNVLGEMWQAYQDGMIALEDLQACAVRMIGFLLNTCYVRVSKTNN